MPKKVLFISIGMVTLIFSIIFLIFYYLYRRDIKIKIQSTSKVEGIVVAYDSRNEVPVSLPIVEYSVNGIKYKKKYDYSYFVKISNHILTLKLASLLTNSLCARIFGCIS